MRTYYFYSAIAGFFAGVALALMGLPHGPATGCLLLLAFSLLLYSWLADSKKRSVFILALVVLLAMAAGLLRAGFDINQPNETVFDPLLEEPVTADGIVTTVPELTSSGQNFVATLSEVRSREEDVVLEGESRAVVYAGSFPEVQYGDVIMLEGRLSEPEVFETDTGRLFNYPRYLARQEVFYEISQPSISITGANEGNPVKGWLTSWRESFLSVLHEHIPDPHAALTGGVLLGVEDALGEGLQESFRDTGLIHIVVLSGYNVTVVAVAIAALLLFAGLPTLVASAAAAVGIALFALLVGLTPTVVRASIMAIIALVARVFSRQYAASRGLALAAVIMVAINPHILLFDPSFQLSAIATAGLIGLGDQISGWLTALPRRFGIREAATATIAAQIAVSPLLVFYTGELSVVSFLANMLVLPVVPVLMSAGALTAVIGLFLENLTLPFAAGSYFVAEYIFTVVDWLATASFTTVGVGSIPLVGVVSVYAGLIIIFIKMRKKEIPEKPLK